VAAFALAATLSATACRGGGGTAAPPTTTVPPTTTTTEPVAVPGAIRTATGAGGAPRDDRIGPPGNGRPSDGTSTVGACFNEFLVDLAGEASHVTAGVDCGLPHDGEVFNVVQLDGPPGSPFAGDREVGRLAGVTCLDAFEPYVGREYATSRLRIAVLRPTESTWSRGDRTVVCTLYDLDLRPLVGTLRGTAA
jgi:hypothetical protein